MKTQDLTGNKFGELVAVKRVWSSDRYLWECACSCGNTVKYSTSQLNAGNAKTCKSMLHRLPYKVGEQVGQLTITSLYRDSKNRRYKATCVCVCGNTYTTAVRNLQRAVNPNCGCKRDISNLGKPAGVAIFNALVSSYKSNAKNKNLEFSLTDKECSDLFKGACYFCGSPPYKVFKKKNIKGTYTYSGIDRIDSSKGYVTDNVNSCCSKCNYLKSDSSIEDFIAHIMTIAKHLDGQSRGTKHMIDTMNKLGKPVTVVRY